MSRTTTHLLAIAMCGCIAACDSGSNGEAGGVTLAFATASQTPDPVVLDFPIAYISRALTADAALNRNSRSLRSFEPGAALNIKDRAEPSAPAVNLLEIFGEDADLFDVRDLQSDYDGSRLVFSMRGPFIEGQDEEDQPTWNIWIYDADADELSRVMTSDTLAEAGQDRHPQFLPDGRIVFTSDRQRRARAILLDEGRPQFAALDEDRDEPAFVLHTMEMDGTNIEQISFNQSHDQYPSVDPDGRIVFSRWDNVPGHDAISLYRIDPDGTQLERLYGYHSQRSGPGGERSLFLNPSVLDDGSIIVESFSDQGQDIAARPLLISALTHVEQNVPVLANAGDTSAGQEALFDTTLTDTSPGGRFATARPVFDGTDRILAAWSPCRLIESRDNTSEAVIVPCTADRIDAGLPEAAPLYGLWMFDPRAQTQQPIVTPAENIAITDAVVLGARALPFVRLPNQPDVAESELIDHGMGILDIRSVYDIDGIDATESGIAVLANPTLTSAAARPYTFVRLVKPVSIPGDDVIDVPGTAFGRSSGELMREILGYGIVHPDGSIRMQVPANVPFAISLLSADGKRISPRHRNWLQVRPGETLHCRGCHEQNSTYPHGRRDAEATSINPGAPWAGLNPALAVATGSTIAQGVAELLGTPLPQANPVFEDIWSNPADTVTADPFALRYEDLLSPAPTTGACISSWRSLCRITIHYPWHIHPLWSVPRVAGDTDNTCTACHSPVDAMGAARVPASQLDLSGGPSPDQADHLVSYRELLFGDVEQEVVNGALVDRLVQVIDGAGNPVFETDEDGELILDAGGDPIPVLRTVPVRPVLSTAGALSSSRFFSRFEPGGTHAGFLTPAELRLVAEWLDIGAQYYNDPFAVRPQ